MAVQAKPLFGRYTDAELIGAGVIGEVYRATDSLLGRVVAVRVLARRFNDDLTVRQRFIRETLAAAPLSAHPHTVTLYDVGDWEGQAYAVMAYLLVTAVIIIIFNLIADIMYGFLDPRIRYD